MKETVHGLGRTKISGAPASCTDKPSESVYLHTCNLSIYDTSINHLSTSFYLGTSVRKLVYKTQINIFSRKRKVCVQSLWVKKGTNYRKRTWFFEMLDIYIFSKEVILESGRNKENNYLHISPILGAFKSYN